CGMLILYSIDKNKQVHMIIDASPTRAPFHQERGRKNLTPHRVKAPKSRVLALAGMLASLNMVSSTTTDQLGVECPDNESSRVAKILCSIILAATFATYVPDWIRNIKKSRKNGNIYDDENKINPNQDFKLTIADEEETLCPDLLLTIRKLFGKRMDFVPHYKLARFVSRFFGGAQQPISSSLASFFLAQHLMHHIIFCVPAVLNSLMQKECVNFGRILPSTTSSVISTLGFGGAVALVRFRRLYGQTAMRRMIDRLVTHDHSLQLELQKKVNNVLESEHDEFKADREFINLIDFLKSHIDHFHPDFQEYVRNIPDKLSEISDENKGKLEGFLAKAASLTKNKYNPEAFDALYGEANSYIVKGSAGDNKSKVKRSYLDKLRSWYNTHTAPLIVTDILKSTILLGLQSYVWYVSYKNALENSSGKG
ncbi:MAG: hypothetical protein AAF621_00695, partial [Pseudomonadota bacterium]